MKNLLSPKALQNLMLIFVLFFMSIIAFLSIEIRNETKNPLFWDIDFKKNADIISAYGTLIGGILSFLSILFVLYNIYEVRQQLQNEKLDKIYEEREANVNRLRLITVLMENSHKIILKQGEHFKRFVDLELENPSASHILIWVTAKDFERLSDFDAQLIFSSFQTVYVEDKWEQIMSDYYVYNDFYLNSIDAIRKKILSNAEEKFKIIASITDALESLSFDIDNYIVWCNQNPKVGENIQISDWNGKIIEFFYKLQEYVMSNIDGVDLRIIKNDYLQKLIDDVERIVKGDGFDGNGEEEIFNKIVYIRNRIDNLERNSIQFAKQLHEQYIRYYSIDSKNVSKYGKIIKDLKGVIEHYNKVKG